MDRLVSRIGFWSSAAVAVLVLTIDIGMIASTMLFPMSSIPTMEAYASSFSTLQMLPFIPSLMLAPAFIIMMLCIHYWSPQEKKVLSQLGFSFSIISGAILSIHYYIQLAVVQQGILSNELTGLWQFAAPNPHSFFWTFAALGYGFMGLALFCFAPIFAEKPDRAIKWLLFANGAIGIAFLVGNALGLFVVNMLVSFVWGVLFPMASALISRKFWKQR